MNGLTYTYTGSRTRVGAPKRRSRSLRRRRAVRGQWTPTGQENSSASLFLSWAF